MVYYSGLPLLMTQQQQQQQQQQQTPQHQHGTDGAIPQLGYSDTNAVEQYAGQSPRNGGPSPYQQQPHHTISLTNGLTISNGPQNGGTGGSGAGSNGELTIVLNPPAQQGHQLTISSVAGAGYSTPASPIRGGGGGSSPSAESSYAGQTSTSTNTTTPVTASSKFRCEQCNISFGSKSAHTSHMKSHAKQQQQANEKTGVKNVDAVALTTNGVGAGAGTLGQHPGQQQPDPYQCDVCKKTFAVPARLVRHYRTHTGERPFECEFCHKMFSVKENLQVHRRIHTKERPYKCEICGRAFEHSGKLHRHMRIHTGERPHKCNVCGKTFIQSGQLVIHMRTHTGEKPYKCPVEGCGKGFTCSKQLKVHSRTHTGEKPYHCDICFRDFGYNHVLKLHRVQHYGAKCYKCTICDETFKSKKEMEAHIKGHANELPDEDEASEESGCKQEDVPSSGGEATGALPALDGGCGSNSNSNSNSSFEYSSSPSQTEGAETGPSGDEPSRGVGYTGMKSPVAVASVNHGPQSPSVDEDDDDEEDMEEDEVEQKQISQYGVIGGQPFDHSLQQRTYGGVSTGGVAPALLAAASIAAAVENGCPEMKFCPDVKHQRTMSPVQTSSLSITRITPPPSSGSSSSSSSSSSLMSIPPSTSVASSLLDPTNAGMAPGAGQFMYEPLSIMKHHGYFAPASQIAEFRSSSDIIVRQVEAAIAGTENLLTPPRSSPESPDRSSSPESDSVLMADRDNNTLPPRKRKLYFKDSQQQHQSHPAVASAPKLLSLDEQHRQAQQQQQQQQEQQEQQQQQQQQQSHYVVVHQSMTSLQASPPEAHVGHHHQHHLHSQQQQQELIQHSLENHHLQSHPHYLHPRPEEQSVKLEVLQNMSTCHDQRQHSRTPPVPTTVPPQPQASVIRMSSVIQYANKSS